MSHQAPHSDNIGGPVVPTPFYLPRSSQVALGLRILPRRIEVGPLDTSNDDGWDVADALPAPVFCGPLAALKQLANELSSNSLKIYVTHRRNKLSTTIKVELRSPDQRWAQTFGNEADARSFIEANAAVEILESPEPGNSHPFGFTEDQITSAVEGLGPQSGVRLRKTQQ